MRDDLLQVIKKSKKPELQASAAILKRIDYRDLYKLVGERIISKELKEKVCAKDICDFADDFRLKSSDLLVHTFRLDWGNGEHYPLDSMTFFDSEKPETPCTLHLNKNETSQYRPK